MDIIGTHTTTSPQQTTALGARLGDFLLAGEGEELGVLCLWGELGSGKTTFTQGLVRSLGSTSRLLSPTFIIVRRYDLDTRIKTVYHVDLYRLEHERDLSAIGMTEFIDDPDALVIIEWPERMGSMLPKKRMDITFATHSDGAHQIHIQAPIG